MESNLDRYPNDLSNEINLDRILKRRNALMKGGKQGVANRRIEECRENRSVHGRKKGRRQWLISEGDQRDNKRIRSKALERLMPTVETETVKRGGGAYQVPHPVAPKRRVALAVRWRVKAAKKKAHNQGVSMSVALALEVMAVLEEQAGVKGVTSEALAQRNGVHRTAKAHQVYAHLRWR